MGFILKTIWGIFFSTACSIGNSVKQKPPSEERLVRGYFFDFSWIRRAQPSMGSIIFGQVDMGCIRKISVNELRSMSISSSPLYSMLQMLSSCLGFPPWWILTCKPSKPLSKLLLAMKWAKNVRIRLLRYNQTNGQNTKIKTLFNSFNLYYNLEVRVSCYYAYLMGKITEDKMNG